MTRAAAALLLLGLLAAPLHVEAEQAGKVQRVGLVANLPPPPDPVSLALLVRADRIIE